MIYLGCLTHHPLEAVEEKIQYSLKKSNEFWWIAAVRESICLNMSPVSLDNLKKKLDVIRRHAIKVGQDFKKINVIVNETINPNYLECEFNVFSIDIYRAIAFYYLHYTNQKFNSIYYPNSEKALFLMGKPHKCNRTPVLIELINRGLEPKLVYSWYTGEPNDELFEFTREVVKRSGFTDINLDEFASRYTKTLDVPKHAFTDPEKTQGSFHYSGYPFDHTHYHQTCVSIVSETHVDNCPIDQAWLTEKLWRTIANHHPFILASSPAVAEHLKNKGYETWDSYLLHDQQSANLDWDPNPKKPISMIGDNVDYFIKNFSRNKNTFTRLAHKNFKLMMEHAKQDIASAFSDTESFTKFINCVKFENFHWKDNL